MIILNFPCNSNDDTLFQLIAEVASKKFLIIVLLMHAIYIGMT